MTGMHYIKIEYQQDTLVISGREQMGIEPFGGRNHNEQTQQIIRCPYCHTQMFCPAGIG